MYGSSCFSATGKINGMTERTKEKEATGSEESERNRQHIVRRERTMSGFFYFKDARGRNAHVCRKS